MANYVLIGCSGFVAPRHMAAIKAIGGNLIAALDPHDSVGVLDRYFPECKYFSEFERFDRHCSMKSIDYVSICSPNYLHDAHCRFALRIGADAICEKPLVLNTRNITALKQIEIHHGKKINVILQMRLHKQVKKIKPPQNGARPYVRIEYIAPRGAWYLSSWKGDVRKSGGLATNIGIHLLDLTTHLYGPMTNLEVFSRTDTQVAGLVELERADVDFVLSINGNKPTRTFQIDGLNHDFTEGFDDLHTLSYERIIAGRGFGVEQIAPATEICEAIRNF